MVDIVSMQREKGSWGEREIVMKAQLNKLVDEWHSVGGVVMMMPLPQYEWVKPHCHCITVPLTSFWQSGRQSPFHSPLVTSLYPLTHYQSIPIMADNVIVQLGYPCDMLIPNHDNDPYLDKIGGSPVRFFFILLKPGCGYVSFTVSYHSMSLL